MAEAKGKPTWSEFFRLMFGPGPGRRRPEPGRPSRWDWATGAVLIAFGVALLVIDGLRSPSVFALGFGVIRLVRCVTGYRLAEGATRDGPGVDRTSE